MTREDDDLSGDPTVQQLAAMYHEHHLAAGPVQRLANRATSALGRPASVAGIVVLIAIWILGNSFARVLGWPPLERFPFPELALIMTIAAVVVALLILTTQRHEDQLAEKRARLTLQIAVLSENKIAKVIELLEEQRRDNPLLSSRTDLEADAMSAATDPRATLQQMETSGQVRGPLRQEFG